MKRYTIDVPFTGYTTVTVEASSKKEAIRKAFESDELTVTNCTEVEFVEMVVQGNVFYGVKGEIEIYSIEDIEDTEE